MKIELAVSLCLLLCYGLVCARQQTYTVNDLGWLKGCWRASGNGREINEHWMAPGGGTMLGMSRTVVNGRAVEFEFIQLRQGDGGEVYFDAKPSGQEPASFKLTRGGRREAVFENPEHDFPQKIVYRLEDDGSLSAGIEGEVKGKRRSLTFNMKRDRCD